MAERCIHDMLEGQCAICLCHSIGDEPDTTEFLGLLAKYEIEVEK